MKNKSLVLIGIISGIVILAVSLSYYFYVQSRPTLYHFNFDGIDFSFYDSSNTGIVARFVSNEINSGIYTIKNFTCEPGDVMIDIGANLGITSIVYAKKYPGLRIYAYEPVPENFKLFLKNIEINKVTNIIPFAKAVTGDGRKISMQVDMEVNPAGSTVYYTNESLKKARAREYFDIESVTLDQVFAANGITKCKLLKIDCEGSEYEILYNTTKLKSIEYLLGEFHGGPTLKAKGYTIPLLSAYLKKTNPAMKIQLCYTQFLWGEIDKDLIDYSIKAPPITQP